MEQQHEWNDNALGGDLLRGDLLGGDLLGSDLLGGDALADDAIGMAASNLGPSIVGTMLHFFSPVEQPFERTSIVRGDGGSLSASTMPRRAWLRLATRASLAAIAGPWSSSASSANGAPAGRPVERPVAQGRIAEGRGPGWNRAKSVIVVFASGGQSQLDMWDPKPDAPLDVRGDFRAIATRLAGVRVCEHLPRVAGVLDRCTLVRSMSHEDLDHGSAVYLALTGHYHPRRSSNPSPAATDFPTLGALVRRLRPASRFLCDALHLNGPALVPTTPSPGQNGGFLGRGVEPWVVGDVLDARGAMPGLEPRGDWAAERLDARLALKRSLDAFRGELDSLSDVADLNRWFVEARQLLDQPAARVAFDLERESSVTRSRYGHHRSGQALLLARRLVEAGVPYINVIWNHSNRGQDTQPDDTDSYGWDTHNDIFSSLRDRLLPRFDESFSALIEDLDQRGLLDDTLVVCMGEFGRAPRVALEPRFAGATPGRKHWAGVYSLVMAGAGVQRGAVVGQSDRMGAEPVTARYGPWDVAATIFHSLGIAPDSEYQDASERPFRASEGRPMAEVVA